MSVSSMIVFVVSDGYHTMIVIVINTVIVVSDWIVINDCDCDQ